MKNKIRLVGIFAIVILFSFIPESFPGFFGDWACQGGKVIHIGDTSSFEGCFYGPGYPHCATTHWGFRHWMWSLCGLTLFVWNVIELLNNESNK